MSGGSSLTDGRQRAAARALNALWRGTALGCLLGAPGQTLAQEVVALTRQDQQPVAGMAYRPQTGHCRGVAIVSPGAGGSETGYRYLGEAMSGFGYLTVVVGHAESGLRALRDQVRGRGLRDGLADLITEPAAHRGRFMDVAAARQWAERQCPAGDAVLLGHSMGAATTMMSAGARNVLGVEGTAAYSAYIALSPQGAGLIFPRGAWSDIRRPVLSITGTRDDELGGGSWHTRTEPYANMPPGCKWLAVIDGATHMNLAGRGASRRTEQLTVQVMAAFLEAVRNGSCAPPSVPAGVDLQTK